MTSTTYNRYADPATDESKTEFSNELHGRMSASSRGRKGILRRMLLAMDTLLPRQLRVVKSKRGRYRSRYGFRTQFIAFRINWRAVYKKKLLNKLGIKN
jgi:hypothetical protein